MVFRQGARLALLLRRSPPPGLAATEIPGATDQEQVQLQVQVQVSPRQLRWQEFGGPTPGG